MSGEPPADRDITDPIWLQRPIEMGLRRTLELRGCEAEGHVLDIDFSILDATTDAHLEGVAHLPCGIVGPFGDRLIVPAVRRQLPSGRIEYDLRNDAVGPLGRIILRQLEDRVIGITFTSPPEPWERMPSSEEIAEAEAYQKAQTGHAGIDALKEQLQAEQGAHVRWRCVFRAVVINELFARIENEIGWLDKRREQKFEGVPNASVRAAQTNRKAQDRTMIALDKLRKLRNDLIQKGQQIPTLTTACSQAGISYKTAVKHAPELCEHWDDKEYLEIPNIPAQKRS